VNGGDLAVTAKIREKAAGAAGGMATARRSVECAPFSVKAFGYRSGWTIDKQRVKNGGVWNARQGQIESDIAG